MNKTDKPQKILVFQQNGSGESKIAGQVGLGQYGEKFGKPTFRVEVTGGRIAQIRVLQGAPCGATWQAAPRILNLPLDEALVRIGLDVRYFCTADPAGWDPVHLAGRIHQKALAAALQRTDGRGQMTEVSGQMADDRGQRSDGR